MAAQQGIFVVQQHSHWSDPDQLFVGKVTIEANTPVGSFRREYVITAADVVSFAAQLINLLTQQAITHQVDVLPNNADSFTALTAAGTLAEAKWTPG